VTDFAYEVQGVETDMIEAGEVDTGMCGLADWEGMFFGVQSEEIFCENGPIALMQYDFQPLIIILFRFAC